MKKGLILEGGAMRGMYTAGVTDVMMENGIEFDGAVGVSAGAAFGCNYKSRQIGRAARYNMRFCNDKRYCSVRSLITTGNIYNTDFCYNEVPTKYDPFDFETYINNPMEFYVVCTNVETGEPVYKKFEGTEDSRFDWIRASASMPLVSRIVEIDGLKMLDGGISDSIPLKFFEGIGYDRNVVILTRPLGYRKNKNKLQPVIKARYAKYPALTGAMANRHTVYNASLDYIEEKEKAGELFVFRPEAPLPVSRTEKNPEKLKAAYEIGRQDAAARLDELKEYLKAGR
ncbi:MAG: patatin family protein [Candidatus Avispirillum sp.]